MSATTTLPHDAGPQGAFAVMVGVSVLAHVVLLGLVVVADRLGPGATAEERPLMTISLGGAPGPRSGGITPLPGRAVQEVAPVPPKPAPAPPPEAQRPPAAKPPAMTVPAPTPRPVRTPSPPAATRPAPAEARGTSPTTGPEVRRGSALVETGAKGIAFGLSTGGGGGTGGEIDVSNFCCPDYLTTMVDLIQRNWSSKQPVAGTATIRFSILRDGTVSDVAVARSSGYAVLDLTAQRAVAMARMPPLPAAFRPERLTVHLNFQYQR
jgi:protein TonB